MRKILSVLLAFMLSLSFAGCAFSSVTNAGSTDSAKSFYDKVNESKALLDLVATDVCAAWKDAQYDYNLSTKDVNNAIEKAKKEHGDDITKINELDIEIRDVFDKAKDEMNEISAKFALEQVMIAYSEYKDSILNANEALDSSGYVGVSISKDSLDRALQELFVKL